MEDFKKKEMDWAKIRAKLRLRERQHQAYTTSNDTELIKICEEAEELFKKGEIYEQDARDIICSCKWQIEDIKERPPKAKETLVFESIEDFVNALVWDEAK